MRESLTKICREQRFHLRGIYFGVTRLIEKRDRTNCQGRSVSYKNTLKLNEDYSREMECVSDRIPHKKLVDQAMALFDMGG